MSGDAKERGNDILVGGGEDFGAEFAGEVEVLLEPALAFVGERASGVDVDGEPWGPEAVREAAGPAGHGFGERAWAEGDEEPGSGLPDLGDRVGGAEVAGILADAFGGEAEGKFAERGEVAFTEEVPGGLGGAVGKVDLAGAEAVEEFVGRKVDEFDAGLVEDGVGDGFVNGGAGDLADGFGAAFDMLDVEGGVDVDAGIEEF